MMVSRCRPSPILVWQCALMLAVHRRRAQQATIIFTVPLRVETAHCVRCSSAIKSARGGARLRRAMTPRVPTFGACMELAGWMEALPIAVVYCVRRICRFRNSEGVVGGEAVAAGGSGDATAVTPRRERAGVRRLRCSRLWEEINCRLPSTTRRRDEQAAAGVAAARGEAMEGAVKVDIQSARVSWCGNGTPTRYPRNVVCVVEKVEVVVAGEASGCFVVCSFQHSKRQIFESARQQMRHLVLAAASDGSRPPPRWQSCALVHLNTHTSDAHPRAHVCNRGTRRRGPADDHGASPTFHCPCSQRRVL